MEYEIDEIVSVEVINEDFQDVYDIGMVDTPHTFFANDILVHNSLYFNGGSVLKSINYPHYNDLEKTRDFIMKNLEILMTKIIDKRMQFLALKRLNCKNCIISFKREMIARKVAFIAKKRYTAWVQQMEDKKINNGDDHELETKGHEMVKTVICEPIRNMMKEYVLNLLKDGEKKNCDTLYKEMRERFNNLPISTIAKISNVNNLNEYTDEEGDPLKGSPGHVKCAIIYNKMIKSKGLEDKYELIYSGDKIKLVYIKPTPYYKYTAIAFKGDIPEEFGLKQYIDYDTMWEKLFVKPIQVFYEIQKWKLPNIDQEDITDLFF